MKREELSPQKMKEEMVAKTDARIREIKNDRQKFVNDILSRIDEALARRVKDERKPKKGNKTMTQHLAEIREKLLNSPDEYVDKQIEKLESIKTGVNKKKTETNENEIKRGGGVK